MTPREIVERTLNFDYPERVARTMPEPWGTDILGAGPTIDRGTGWQQIDEQTWERTDEWGNLWRRIDPTSKGEVVRGVLQDLGQVDELDLPAVDPATTFEAARQRYADNPKDLFPIGGIPGFTFNICRKIRKLDQYFEDLLADRARLRRLHDRIDDLLEQWIVGLAGAGAKAIIFAEDWGTQLAPFISPALFREEFFPRFQRLCGAAHRHGMYVLMHSCGKVTPLIPQMVEAGVNCFQFDQPRLHTFDELEKWHGRVTFWCPVDIQVTLPKKDGDRIVEDVHEMLDRLWRGRGGFIAGYYGDNASIGLEPGWQELACEQFVRYGVRQRYVG